MACVNHRNSNEAGPETRSSGSKYNSIFNSLIVWHMLKTKHEK